jgi:histone-lysine N-methyltransferase SETMAR
VHHYQLESECFNVTETSKHFKITSTPSAGKVMLTVFCDSQGVMLAHFQKRCENMNSASYCEDLLKLRNALRRRLPDHLARGDNARPHTARATQEEIQDLQWELLEHPPYSPDLAPHVFHLFFPLRTTLVGNV